MGLVQGRPGGRQDFLSEGALLSYDVTVSGLQPKKVGVCDPPSLEMEMTQHNAANINAQKAKDHITYKHFPVIFIFEC